MFLFTLPLGSSLIILLITKDLIEACDSPCLSVPLTKFPRPNEELRI